MKVLYVTGACLTRNTSANMSHNGFVKGLLENGADVDIVMASSSWGEQDAALPRWSKATYYEYGSVSFSDKLRSKFRSKGAASVPNSAADDSLGTNVQAGGISVRDIAKKVFFTLFPLDPLYPLEKQWLSSAKKFKGSNKYDIIISNSSPAASHKLVKELLKSGRVVCGKWIQIWEDPWYYDLYGGSSKLVLEEERRLLQDAQEIYYVSPLTLMYQKKYFPDCASKMKCIPLPFFEYTSNKKENRDSGNEGVSFGYFGDYFSKTRNLRPFYEALVKTGHKGYIFGDSDEGLAGQENIEISGRVTLDKLAKVQDKTKVLVHLCNLSGGQIPGKIYHYSATNKPILFILDGTTDEKAHIREFFEQFDRYYFCENDSISITNTMKRIIDESRIFKPVGAFEPIEVVRKLLSEEESTIH